MKIFINDKILLMLFESDNELAFTKERFTIEDKSNVFMGGTFDVRKIKKKCFLKKRGEFYYLNSGYLYDLLTFVKKESFQVTELKDKRTIFPHQKKEFSNEELKVLLPNFNYVEHQVDSLKKLLKFNLGIIQAPTSSGKSETIIAFLKATRVPSLILVNRVSLALQLKERIENNGIENVGICYGKGVVDGDVMISTIGSVGKIPSLIKYKALILDEVHRASAKQFQDFLSKTSYPLRFGFSATPDSGDFYKWNLIRQYMGTIIYKIDPEILMENKVIAKPKIKFIPISSRPTADWPSANIECIVKNTIRNNKIKDLVEEHNVPTLILIRNIEHGKTLNDIIPNSVFVSGIDDALKRQETIHEFEEGTLNIIISSNIFNEGISINAIKLLIIASGGKSKIETIQKLGRGLRVKDDKYEVTVFDFDDYDNYYTSRHSKLRKNIYKKAGFEVIE
ncbi:MAG TPA: DEAD/DEAH box helicase family protein [Candidatus Paceibacterota bacterium]|nr:DEAD/DEAH box helicase family protein [Candidatus Paceibacterota bacterium]